MHDVQISNIFQQLHSVNDPLVIIRDNPAMTKLLNAHLHTRKNVICSLKFRICSLPAVWKFNVIFMDAFVADDVADIGGDLFSCIGERLFFSSNLSKTIDKWRHFGEVKIVITHRELSSIVVALHVWEAHLKWQGLVLYIDNGAARHAMVIGWSRN